MRSRKLVPVLWASALLFGMVLGGSPRALHAAEERAKEKAKGKGKVGDVCKTASDCQQKPRPLMCRENDGLSRCYEIPMRPVT